MEERFATAGGEEKRTALKPVYMSRKSPIVQ
jgi:hypothetical protein